MGIFRANVPRLTVLDEDTIRCLVAIHGNNEHVEMLIAERAKSIKHGPCTIYVFEKDDPSIEQFRSVFTEGAELVDHAIEALEAKREASQAKFAGTAAGAATVARLLGFTERKPDVTELTAAQTRAAVLPAIDAAARAAAMEQAI
jgi:hypothetical protein